jgi:putative hydrolase of the HAD superfamily
MLDVGGCIYDDDRYAQALLQATRELAGGPVDEQEFWDIYDRQRQAQGGLSSAVAERFIPGGDSQQLSKLAGSYLDYTVSSLYPDVKPTLTALATRYKLGVVANQGAKVIEALRRDGLMGYFSVVATPENVGARKPDPRMWRWALDQAGVPASRAVHVGNRLDNDVRAAKKAGLYTVWLLRGEAPPAPTVEQLTEADAVITAFAGVPGALVSIGSTGGSKAAVPAGSRD